MFTASCSAIAESSGVFGGSNPQARARPSALGTQGVAGRTNANNSIASNKGRAGCTFNRPATNSACATITSPERNRRRAASKSTLAVAPCASAITAPLGAGISAGKSRLARNSFGICAQ